MGAGRRLVVEVTAPADDRSQIRGTARAKGWDVAHSDTAIADYLGRGHSSVIVSYQSSDHHALMVALHSRGGTTDSVDVVLGWLR